MHFSDRLKKTVVGGLVIFGLFVAGTHAVVRVFEHRLAARTEAWRIRTAQAVYDAQVPTAVPSSSVSTSTDFMDAPLNPREVRLEFDRLRGQNDSLLALIVAEKEGSRTLLTLDTLGIIQSASWQNPSLRILEVGWNASTAISQIMPRVIQNDKYTLTVPYNTRWGNFKYSVQAFEEASYVPDGGSGAISFGPIYGVQNELGGPTRFGGFVRMPKRTESEALADEDSWTSAGGSCARTRQGTVDDMVRVGTFRALRLEHDYCEGKVVVYEVFGEKANYVFSWLLFTDDALLRWTIERFKEK